MSSGNQETFGGVSLTENIKIEIKTGYLDFIWLVSISYFSYISSLCSPTLKLIDFLKCRVSDCFELMSVQLEIATHKTNIETLRIKYYHKFSGGDMIICSNCDCSKNLLDTILLLLDTVLSLIHI